MAEMMVTAFSSRGSAEQLDDLLAGVEVEVACGLVGEHERGVVGQGARRRRAAIDRQTARWVQNQNAEATLRMIATTVVTA